MANAIELAQKFQPILDEIYKMASLTARMDSPSKPVNFAGANVVKIYKVSTVGMGNYSRADGYAKGDVTGSWEVHTLAIDRGREMSIDRMDDEETLGMAFGTLAGEFMWTDVIPETDAYRFSAYASKAGIFEVGTPATLTVDTVLPAIDLATKQMNGAEVPREGRLLYVSEEVQDLMNRAVTRMYGNESGVSNEVTTYNRMPVIMVPQSRFYKGITLDPGTETNAGGYSKTAATGRDINFLQVHPSALIQVNKFALMKIFDPDTNQDKDAWKIQYRQYYDAFVRDNKVKGIYSHIKAS